MGMQTGERASSEDAKDWAKTRMSRRNGFLSDLIEIVLTRFWTFGIIDEPPSGEITISWSDLLAPSKAEKIADADKMADVAVKTQNAFGRSAIKENEIRAAAELPTLPEYEIELPPLPIGDPLTDDKQTSGPAGDTKKQSGPNSKQPPGK